jgi:hypothetical protein
VNQEHKHKVVTSDTLAQGDTEFRATKLARTTEAKMQEMSNRKWVWHSALFLLRNLFVSKLFQARTTKLKWTGKDYYSNLRFSSLNRKRKEKKRVSDKHSTLTLIFGDRIRIVIIFEIVIWNGNHKNLRNSGMLMNFLI